MHISIRADEYLQPLVRGRRGRVVRVPEPALVAVGAAHVFAVDGEGGRVVGAADVGAGGGGHEVGLGDGHVICIDQKSCKVRRSEGWSSHCNITIAILHRPSRHHE